MLHLYAIHPGIISKDYILFVVLFTKIRKKNTNKNYLLKSEFNCKLLTLLIFITLPTL